MANILGLDLGTNSIGWAVINNSEEQKNIIGSGSRIIPMTQDTMGAFTGGGNIETQTKVRTGFRGARRLAERSKLRRERLLRVLNVMGFLPQHFADTINFDHAKPNLGKIPDGSDSKVAWVKSPDGIYEFIFKEAFEDMLKDFAQAGVVEKIPYDWTLYYLRKKGLTHRLTDEELAWVLLSFNQKRGYYQLRGEDEEDENPTKSVEYHKLLVSEVTADEAVKNKDPWYNIHLENGWVYRRQSKTPLFDWSGKLQEFIVTTELDSNGDIKRDKDGNEKRSFRAPKEGDWTLLKKRTESNIRESNKTVGEYIYENLLTNPKQKIRGALVRTVERYFYKDELNQILTKQIELNDKLRDRELYSLAINELYRSNTAYRNSIANRDFKYLLIDDILLYQRPLKSKKSLIDNCPYESRCFVNKEGERVTQGVKCIAKSNPLFQEIRLWQFIRGLKIFRVEDGKDIDVTSALLPTEEAIVALYEWLNNRDSIKQSTLLSSYFKIKKMIPHRWNYVEDREYPCNTTRAIMLVNLKKSNVSTDILSREMECDLWHILYSVVDKYEIVSALQSFAKRYGLSEAFVDTFKKIKPFESDYGAYSEKAIKKLLPLMRVGKYWSQESIDTKTQERVEKVIDGEYDESIRERLYRSTINLRSIEEFRYLPLWLACYVVYDRHSEAKEITKWGSPDDLQQYITEFKQHSLHNPVVEQVVLESLRVVKDIWMKYGSIDKINIELGRELKQDKKSRERATRNNVEQESTNLRIKAMLMEFMSDPDIEEVRPQSPSQQLLLKIYEDGALRSTGDIPDDINKISKSATPTKSEILRYKLWLQQRYRSPYTGEIISLGRLFTRDYEIEHVIPQKLYFDDSFTNKVICEAAVNGLKGARLAMSFIEEEQGRMVDVGYGKSVRIFTTDEYRAFVKSNYADSRTKQNKLLMSEVPDGFISRQLNDTRYISKLMMGLMSNIVRDESEEDIAISTNVLTCNGAITTKLKQEWGLNDIWSRVITPRFERLNEMTSSSDFGVWVNRDGKRFFQINMPLDKQKGFNKKRIDHRHHSLDAMVIASVTRTHVNYLNNLSAKDGDANERYDLKHKLCEKIKQDDRGNYIWRFKKPWDSYTQDVESALRSIIVSFKQNTRVLNRTNNRTEAIGEDGRKIYKMQEGENMAIRKSLHKDTVFGRVNLRLKKMVSLKDGVANYKSLVDLQLKQVIGDMLDDGATPKAVVTYFKDLEYRWFGQNISKVEVYYFTDDSKEPMVATRKSLDKSFDRKKIEAITDTGIQKILLEWLSRNGENSELAFSAEGIAEMNMRITELNGGRLHQPILKVRWSTVMGKKFPVGEQGNRSSKYVVADEGTNLYFGIYQSATDENKRNYESIPLNIVVERLKQRYQAVPEVNEAGEALLFSLSPNDLVYVPTEEQAGRPLDVEDIDLDRIYKMVSSTGNQCFFIKATVATSIIDKQEFSPLNKMERAITGEMIKATCIKIKVDRLGCITQIGGRKV